MHIFMQKKNNNKSRGKICIINVKIIKFQTEPDINNSEFQNKDILLNNLKFGYLIK